MTATPASIPFQTTPDQHIELAGIVVAMEKSAVDRIFIAAVSELARFDQGVFDLMVLWRDSGLDDVAARGGAQLGVDAEALHAVQDRHGLTRPSRIFPLSPRSGQFGGSHRPQRLARGRMGWGHLFRIITRRCGGLSVEQ